VAQRTVVETSIALAFRTGIVVGDAASMTTEGLGLTLDGNELIITG